MARDKQREPTAGLTPPSQPGVSPTKPRQTFGGYDIQNIDAYRSHAGEVREVVDGKDIVDKPTAGEPAALDPFAPAALQTLRDWVRARPLDPTSPTAALIQFPRNWTSQRGRYSKFRVGEAGVVGLLRARPTF